LFFARGPLAVSRLVVAVVVDALNAVQNAWPAAHVGKERSEGYFPTFANPDSPTSIQLPLRIVRVAASVQHVCPDLKLRTHAISFGVAVSCSPLGCRFSCKASARSRVSGHHAFKPHHSSFPAIANALHAQMTLLIGVWRYNPQPSKAMLDLVFFEVHEL
jgi:hypothetical protein